MRLLPTAIAIAAPLLVTAATGNARDRNQVPEATPTGEPKDCLPIQSLRNSLVRSDSVIDFETVGGKVYRNTLPNSCPGLGFERRFSYSTSLSQLCSVDIITVLYTSPVSRGASCGLGKFQPVSLVKAATHR